MPCVPDYVKGGIDLRGKVIPIIDLRLKLVMESVPYTDRMCIIVVDIASYAGSTKIGITTDAVVEVSDIKETIIDLIKGAGESGITVKEVAGKLNTKPQRIHVWFGSTGKKINEIKKLGPAKYAWVG